MGQRRFKVWGGQSFFGELVYERAVPPEHFLRQLEALVDWAAFTEVLIQLYRGARETGRPPYAIQVYLTVWVLNMKRMVRLLNGVALGGRAMRTAAA